MRNRLEWSRRLTGLMKPNPQRKTEKECGGCYVGWEQRIAQNVRTMGWGRGRVALCVSSCEAQSCKLKGCVGWVSIPASVLLLPWMSALQLFYWADGTITGSDAHIMDPFNRQAWCEQRGWGGAERKYSSPSRTLPTNVTTIRRRHLSTHKGLILVKDLSHVWQNSFGKFCCNRCIIFLLQWGKQAIVYIAVYSVCTRGVCLG